MIRNIEVEDLESLQIIDKLAFTQIFGDKFHRDFNVLKNNFEISKGGSFLYENNGEILGFIFSRVLGKFGWIGTIVVHPNHQGNGIGKLLINRTISFLEESGCETIGLETMNSLYKNIEVYLRHGFYSITPSFQLGKIVDDRRENYEVTFDYDFIKTIGNSSLSGYDPTNIYENAVKNSWGELIRISDFSTALLEKNPRYDKDDNKILTVYSLIIDESSQEKIIKSLNAINFYAKNHGFHSINFYLNSANALMLKTMLREGYFIKDSRTRMLVKGEYKPNSPECSRWIM